MPDECAEKPVIPGGTVELGLGTDFAVVKDGQDVTLQFGTQTLMMFVLNARVHDMNIVPGESEGVVTFTAVGPDGATVSLDTSCRVRDFVAAPTSGAQLDSPYLLPLTPASADGLEGARVTLRLEVRDMDGRRATDERTVVAHLPPSIQ
jgi:hypothetical protein